MPRLHASSPFGPRGAFLLTDDRLEALSRLLFVAEQRRPFAVLSGPPGVGKSRLFEEFLPQLRRTGRRVVRIDAGGLGRHDLPEALLAATQICGDSSSPWNALEDLIAGQGLTGDGSVWIIDHVDHAADDLPLALDRFAHLLARSDVRGTLILGTSDPSRLGRLAERADWPIMLSRWTAEDTAAAIELAANVSPRLRFSSEAIRRIADEAAGHPATTLRLCELAVLAAELHGAPAIDAELVDEAVRQCAATPDHVRHRSADETLVSLWRD
jgi:hypothetical protein